MTILAIDTTTEFGSVALRREGYSDIETLLHSPDGFGHIVFRQIEQVLQQADIPLEAVDGFAAAIGPGSFTGVRVGLTAAKGLAEVHGKPLAGISNLRAMAVSGKGPLRAVVLDARRGEVYGAVYNAELELVCGEIVEKFPLWLQSLGDLRPEFISYAGAPFRLAVAGTPFASQEWIDAPRGLASAVAHCAAFDFSRGLGRDPVAVDANYVRRSDAELFWQET